MCNWTIFQIKMKLCMQIELAECHLTIKNDKLSISNLSDTINLIFGCKERM